MPPIPPPTIGKSRRPIVVACALIVLAILAAYHNSLSGPFIYDDKDAIVDNASIRHLSTAWSSPSNDTNTAGGRPIFNLSLALSYALSRNAVWGYHAVNLAIHVLAALVLFGIVRRTLSRPGFLKLKASALPVALVVALLWAVHPLLTESITYTVQRAESLTGLFYLLTLYLFIRGVEADEGASGNTLAWFGLSAAACILGMATKEVMVTAPVIVLLYDRVFISGTFKGALRKRRMAYAGLASSWILLGVLVASTGGNRGGSIGFGIGVSPIAYALTQFKAIFTYVRLSLWPNPLVFEYGTFWVKSAGDVVAYAVVVLALLAATIVALFRSAPMAGRPNYWAAGFAGAWFFIILSPTSSIVPGTTQMIVEHRMYLPLAAVIALVVVAVASEFGSKSLWILGALALPLGILTAKRNDDYRSETAIWGDTVAKRPGNAHAQLNFGVALLDEGKAVAAADHFEATLHAEPDSVEAHTDLGTALHVLGRNGEALQQYGEALRIKPDYINARIDLGNLLTQLGRVPDGIVQYREVVRMKPGDAAAHNNLGMALAATGDIAAALAEYGEAVRLNPDFPQARFNLGNALRSSGHLPEAMAQYQEALRLKPGYPEAAMNLGNLFLQQGQLQEAIASFAETLRTRPDFPEAHNSLGVALMRSQRLGEAIEQFTEALRLNPSYAPAHSNIAACLHAVGRDEEATQHLQAAEQLRSGGPH